MTDKKQENKIYEMQMLEQNLQNLIYQKQAFQMELSETKTALKEVENAKEDVFKIIGQLMIKADKDKIKEDLKNKEKLMELRINSIEKQEKAISEKMDGLKEEVLK